MAGNRPNIAAAGIYSSFEEFLMDFMSEKLFYPTCMVAAMVLFIVISLSTPHPSDKKKKKAVALDSEKWINFSITEIEEISHDVKRFRFALQSPEHTVSLLLHLMMVAVRCSLLLRRLLRLEAIHLAESYTATMQCVSSTKERVYSV